MNMLIAKKKALTSAIVVVFVVVNLLFIFLQIHKQSQFVKLSYLRQRLEKEQENLIKQRNEIIHKIYLQQSRKNIQSYANHHGMKASKVSQIHKLDQNNKIGTNETK
jgi:hypothetical protein